MVQMLECSRLIVTCREGVVLALSLVWTHNYVFMVIFHLDQGSGAKEPETTVSSLRSILSLLFDISFFVLL